MCGNRLCRRSGKHRAIKKLWLGAHLLRTGEASVNGQVPLMGKIKAREGGSCPGSHKESPAVNHSESLYWTAKGSALAGEVHCPVGQQLGSEWG